MMKYKRIFLWILLLPFMTFMSGAESLQPTSEVRMSKNVAVEVLYFHFSRRCMTCQSVETESLKAIKALYPFQYKSGLVTFKSVNLDEKDSKPLSVKYKVEGQQLLIINGNKRYDLTDAAFMNAVSSPEKLRLKFKSTIDPLIK